LLDENVSLSQLYKQVEDSVVIIRGLLVQYDFFGRPYYSQVQARALRNNAPMDLLVKLGKRPQASTT
jgi:hypothetical protein